MDGSGSRHTTNDASDGFSSSALTMIDAPCTAAGKRGEARPRAARSARGVGGWRLEWGARVGAR
eukprot:1138062-Prymnesium_polylepis.1